MVRVIRFQLLTVKEVRELVKEGLDKRDQYIMAQLNKLRSNILDLNSVVGSLKRIERGLRDNE